MMVAVGKLAHRELKAVRDHKVLKEFKGAMVQVPKEYKEFKAIKVYREFKDYKVFKVHRAQLEHKV